MISGADIQEFRKGGGGGGHRKGVGPLPREARKL